MISLIRLITLLIAVTIPNAKAFDYFTNCTGSPNYTDFSQYGANLRSLLATLPSQASNSGFYSSSLGQDPYRVYALYLCRADQDGSSCSNCVYQAKTNILHECPSQVWAVLWYDECMVRFNNTPFPHTANVDHSIVAWDPDEVPENKTKAFLEVRGDTMADLVSRVGRNRSRYGTEKAEVTGLQKMYTLGQCTPDLNAGECQRCLKVAITQLPLKRGGKVLQPSCYVRFEPIKFYGDSVNLSFLLSALNNSSTVATSQSDHAEKKKGSSHIVVAVTIPLVVAFLLLCGACICFRYRKRQESSRAAELEEINTAAESLQFDFRTIRAATDNFSVDNKLGEGGFGGVYKGKLPNGQEIAVKRLSKYSGQGVTEFKTEVLLVAKLQHKNLVRLLGFCLYKDEKLLVYELLPNSSLDKILLDPSKGVSLDWETRYKIIMGVARGLLYLHEDSRLKVIHRDLKSSNILLDQEMNPKISDFGLARLAGTGQIQADTNRIIGTYGYMAPEYAMSGRFSIKSDVYSFGVIVLEIISGHKCNSIAFPYHEESVSQRAWSLWKDGKALEMLDPRVGGNFSSEEVARCIHIGLLCIQEDANQRPTMTPIVSALNGHYVDFPAPTRPRIASSDLGFSTKSSSTFSGHKYIVTTSFSIGLSDAE